MPAATPARFREICTPASGSPLIDAGGFRRGLKDAEGAGVATLEAMVTPSEKHRRRLKWGAALLLGAVLAAGAGREIWFCSACDFKDGARLTLGTLPVVRIGFGISGPDQYGSAALWEELHGKPCVHVWSRHGDWFFGWLNYRRGPGDAVHFSRGLRVHALRAIGSIEKSWAIAAWDALRTPDASRRERVEAALDRLGEQAYEAALEDRRPPKEGIAAWWESNRKLMAGSNR